MRVQVQGYAIPWNRVGYADGREETAAPNSISPPRAEGANVTMLFGDHVTTDRPAYAQTRNRSLSFFADSYGLAFSAWLDDDFASHRAVLKSLGGRDVTQCSVNLLSPRFVDDDDGRARLIYARIDHFTLCEGAAYPDTGCWVASQPINDRAPWLRDMSLQYGKALLARERERQQAKATKPSAERPATPPSGAGMGSERPAFNSLFTPTVMAKMRRLGIAGPGMVMGMSPAAVVARINQAAARLG